MGRRKEIKYYNGRLQGSRLTDEDCNRLESIIKLNQKKGCIPELKNIIYDLSPSDVDTILETGSNDLVELRKGELEDPQTLGVAYLYFAKRALLGDSVGLGKTVEVCGLCNLLEADLEKEGVDFRYLLLTGKTLVTGTTRKMVQFTGNYTESLFGEKDKILKYRKEHEGELPPNTVGTHSLLNSVHFQEYILGFKEEYGYCPYDLLVIDEAGDILKNSGNQTYNNSKQIADMFDRVVLLNATSFEKELKQFYNQIHFLDDSFLPTKTEFEKRYMVYQYGVMPYPVFKGEYKNQKEFRQLVGYRYFQRTRKFLGAKMEDCTAEVIVSELSKVQKQLLTMVSMPNMVYDCPSYFANIMPGLETSVETTPKLRDLVDLVNKLMSEEGGCGPILVYTNYKEAQKCIKAELDLYDIDCAIMNGDTPQNVRDLLTTEFQLGDLPVLITNVQKGLDFGNCNYCIFYDYDANPNNMVQFEGRMTRSYDIIGKHVYLLISKGKELSNFKKVIADRAKASDVFTGSDYSCVMSILLNDEKLKGLK